MNEVDFFLSQNVSWLQATGAESDVVISSRIRLARNIKKYPFLTKLNSDEKQFILADAERSAKEIFTDNKAFFIKNLAIKNIDRQFLLERHLISKELFATQTDCAAIITRDEQTSIMVIEEDHLRLQTFKSGLNLKEAWKIADETDNKFAKTLEFAFDSNWGYLTACPTNVGTGLRASCMLHLSGLVLTKQIQQVLQAISKLNLAVRGLYGEGSQAVGNFFQFSNQVTLGQSEEEIIANLESVIQQVVNHEREARESLKKKRKIKVEDHIWRALGVLKSARVISSEETIQWLSLVQLGIDMEILDMPVDRGHLNQIFLSMQPGHLQKTNGGELSSEARDACRAALLRKFFQPFKI